MVRMFSGWVVLIDSELVGKVCKCWNGFGVLLISR